MNAETLEKLKSYTEKTFITTYEDDKLISLFKANAKELIRLAEIGMRAEKMKELLKKQRDMPPEFEKIFQDNVEDLLA